MAHAEPKASPERASRSQACRSPAQGMKEGTITGPCPVQSSLKVLDAFAVAVSFRRGYLHVCA